MNQREIVNQLDAGNKTIAVVGLGYVGLPLALEMALKWNVVGFDIKEDRVAMMKNGEDPSKELDSSYFLDRKITFTSHPEVLDQCSIFIVAVPTPVDERKVPNLTPLISASNTIGKVLKKGDIVIYESTVYPGCTEEDCVPELEKASGLKYIEDFKVGYSPERINPGEREKTVEKITKIVSGCDSSALEDIAAIYSAVIKGGIYKASSIKVAEAAKVIENTQRDLNISFVNELAIIFDKLDIDTSEVLEAAATKWNFVKYTPGLVGGHCIGVDPYYLLFKAKQLGYDPQVILSGRRVNDGMPSYIAKKIVQMLIKKDINPKESRILIKGITFKENVSDVRNSKVADLIHELKQYSIDVDVVDPHAMKEDVRDQHNIELAEDLKKTYDAVVVAVAHTPYKTYNVDYFKRLLNPETNLLFDLKGIYDDHFSSELNYWRL